MGGQLSEWLSQKQTGIDVVYIEQRDTGDLVNTLNIISHATLFVKGSFTVTDLNQHWSFIKLTRSHRWVTVRCADSHLQIDCANPDTVSFVGVGNLFQQCLISLGDGIFFSPGISRFNTMFEEIHRYILIFNFKGAREGICIPPFSKISIWTESDVKAFNFYKQFLYTNAASVGNGQDLGGWSFLFLVSGTR